MRPAPIPQYLSAQTAARRLGLNVETIRRLCRSGRLPAVKLGRSWRIDAHKLDLMFVTRKPGDRWTKGTR